MSAEPVMRSVEVAAFGHMGSSESDDEDEDGRGGGGGGGDERRIAICQMLHRDRQVFDPIEDERRIGTLTINVDGPNGTVVPLIRA